MVPGADSEFLPRATPSGSAAPKAAVGCRPPALKHHGGTPQHRSPVSPPPSRLPTVLPSHASAPGVPGGPAATEAVAPLPGAVDEAQGVFKFLLDGSFLDGLVRKVYLCLDKQKARGLQTALPGVMEDLQGPAYPFGNTFHVSSFPPTRHTDPQAQLSVDLEFTR